MNDGQRCPVRDVPESAARAVCIPLPTPKPTPTPKLVATLTPVPVAARNGRSTPPLRSRPARTMNRGAAACLPFAFCLLPFAFA